MADAGFKPCHVLKGGHILAHLSHADFSHDNDMRLDLGADPAVAHPQGRDRHFHYHCLRVADGASQREACPRARIIALAARHHRHAGSQNAAQHRFGCGFPYRTGDRHQFTVQPSPRLFGQPLQRLIAVADDQLGEVGGQILKPPLDDRPAVAGGVTRK